MRAVGRDSIVQGIADVAFVTLDFPSGVVANVELSWLAPSKLRRTVLVGSEKMVVYDDGTAEPIRLFDHGVVYEDPETFGEYHLSYRTGDILSPKLETYEPLVAELEDFVRAIRFGHEPEASPTLARQVVELAQAADESLRRGGVEIEVGRSGRFAGDGLGTRFAGDEGGSCDGRESRGASTVPAEIARPCGSGGMTAPPSASTVSGGRRASAMSSRGESWRGRISWRSRRRWPSADSSSPHKRRPCRACSSAC